MNYNREAIWIEIGLSIGAMHMTDLLEWIVKERGKPKAIRTDNGPEFTNSVFTNWCHKHRIEIRYIQPGKPTQNAFIERFNRSYRTEVWMQEFSIPSLKFEKLLQNGWNMTTATDLTKVDKTFLQCSICGKRKTRQRRIP